MITAPLDYERYAILLNPLLVPTTGGISSVQQNRNVLPISNSQALTHHHNRDENNSEINQNDENSRSQKNRIILRNSVPFSRPLPETGRGQNIDIWT